MKSKKSAVRFSSSSTDLLHNKYVLYISFFFAILTAARYLFSFNLEAIIIFVILGFLTTYFSKNMIVVLLTTTIGTNFIMMFKNRRTPSYYNIMEGMETKLGATSAPSAGAAPPPGATAAPPPGATGPAAAPTATGAATTASSTSAPSTTSSDMLKLSQAMTAAGSATPPPSGAPITATNTAPAPGTPAAAGGNQAFPKKNKESMTQLSPASYGGSSGDATLSSMFRGMASGAANQRTQAYNTLNSLGGGAGANANTDELLGQQTEMINNLKAIEPVLKTAEKFLDKFENSSISKMFQNMGGNIPGLSLLTGSGGGGASNGIGM
jgi:hypothetical protein